MLKMLSPPPASGRMSEERGGGHRMSQENLAKEYSEKLNKLMFNDKLLINTLSEMANENRMNAKLIVRLIEERIRKIPRDHHLPHIYLIDSICKNHGSPFAELFEINIVETFAHIFKYANEKVRGALYKLRQTWHPSKLFFTKLNELDHRVKQMDPAWPITSSPVVQHSGATSHKILINPAKINQPMNKNKQEDERKKRRDPEESETERMRIELLMKEKELYTLKKKHLDHELEKMKEKENQVSSRGSSQPGSTAASSKPSASGPAAESSQKGASEIRDPRKRRKHEESSNSSSSKSGSSSSSRRSGGGSDKSSPKKSSKSERKSSGSSHSSKSSSSSSGSKSSSKDKDREKSSSSSRKSSSHKDESKKDSSSSKKREREESPKFSRTPSPKPAASSPVADNGKVASPPAADRTSPVLQQNAGRISPLPRPPSKKIPKKTKKDAGSSAAEEKSGGKGEKRPLDVENAEKEGSPPMDKKAKQLMIDIGDVHMEDPDSKHLSPVVAGWAKHKESNPDQFRTPIKEAEPFFPEDNHGQPWRGPPGGPNNRHPRGMWPGPRGQFRHRGRGRGGFMGGGGPFNDRGPGGFFPPGFRGDGAAFGRGGGRMPGGGHPNMPPFQQFCDLNSPEILQGDPESIRSVVVPKLTSIAQECRAKGSITQQQFDEFMHQVESLKATTINREAEQKDRRGPPGPGPRRTLLHDQDSNQQPEIVEVKPDSGARPTFTKQRSPHKNDLPMANQEEIEKISKDPTVTLEIDKVPRPIRYYNYTATITQDDNKLYEISFQREMEQRFVIFDNNFKVCCYVGDPSWVEFKLGRKTHRLKIGGPTRELFIDNTFHNLHFGNQRPINIGGRMYKVFLSGDPPQVDIGRERPDLCHGRVDVVIASGVGQQEKRSNLFLDLKPQLLIIDRKLHICQFVEDYSTVLINKHPFKTNFGGFPMVISVRGNKHYVRLGPLPQGVYLGNNKQPPPQAAKPEPLMSLSVEGRMNNGSEFFDEQVPETLPVDGGPVLASTPVPPVLSSTPVPAVVQLDQPPPNLTQPPPQLDQPPPNISQPPPQLNAGVKDDEPAAPAAAGPAAPDFNDLWAKLQNSGVLNMFAGGASAPGSANGFGSSIPGLDPSIVPTPETLAPPPVAGGSSFLEPPKDQQQEQSLSGSRASRLRRNSVGMKEIVLKSHDPSLKERQQAVVDSLYGPNDLQCKSCGHRFTREEMNNYSSHLDWHFRAKRRERDNARKAQSRRWYYEKADWIVSDEIEDEELDLSEEEVILEQSVEVPTVRVEAEGKEETCPVCLEQFNQVFKQGEEEEEGAWHLHNAMRDPDGVAYHPECYKDKQAQDAKWEEMEDVAGDMDNTDIKQENDKEEGNDVEMTEVKVEKTEDGDAVVKEEKKDEEAISDGVSEVKIEVKKEDDIGSEDKSAEEPTAQVKQETGDDLEPQVDKEAEAGEAATVKTEAGDEAVKTVEGEEGGDDANKTVNLDSSDLQPTPVSMLKPKVDIKVSLTSATKQEMTRQESNMSSEEETEFDKECIVVPAPSQQDKDAAKPKLVGKSLNVVPMAHKDQGMSGLCSIM